MIVETKSLPKELIERLPIAFKISDKFDTRLITDPILKYEIEKFVEYGAPDLEGEKEKEELEKLNRKIFEIVPELSYRKEGITVIEDEVDFIVLLIRNHLRIIKGGYIFDPEIGTRLYEYLKNLDIGSLRESLYSEINDLVRSAVSEFDLKKDIKVENVILRKLDTEEKKFNKEYSDYRGAIYRVEIVLNVNDELIEVSDEFEF